MPRRLFACFGRPAPQGDAVTADAASEERRRGGAVVVELFTSQGCAASPAAEAVASRLGRRADPDPESESAAARARRVVVLGHHVDYWDHAGWRDPFGSSAATVRQKAYAEALRLDTMFTPQAVVQGGSHCVGDDEDALLALIRDAPLYPALAFQATFQRPAPDTLQVTLSGPLRTKVDEKGANVMVALYENGLVTDCPRGENKGRVLANDFVVRKLEKLCTVKDVSAKKAVSGTVVFPLWQGFNPVKCGVAVFVQSPSYQIFGSQDFDLPGDI